MACAIVCPCAAPRASVFRTRTSSVPWRSSPCIGGLPRFGITPQDNLPEQACPDRNELYLLLRLSVDGLAGTADVAEKAADRTNHESPRIYTDDTDHAIAADLR